MIIEIDIFKKLPNY